MNKVMLVVLDGFGFFKPFAGNAVAIARKPSFDFYWNNFPHCLLEASQQAVGLPKGFIGNSEVGHFTIGAGRIVMQELSRVNNSIRDKNFFKNKELLSALNYAKKNNKALHLIGLLSLGGVHSHLSHLTALLKAAKKLKLQKVFIHAFADGRDVAPKSALKHFKILKKEIARLKTGCIASMIGRHFAMDRDENWRRETKAFNLLTQGNGILAESPETAIERFYAQGITDEFFPPALFNPEGVIGEKDAVIFFNFRSDRARELTRAFVQKKFKGFKREFLNLCFTTLTQFDSRIKAKVMFPPLRVENSLGEFLSKKNALQLRAAESEKHAHVTFFFNCGFEKPFKGESRIIVPSPKVKSFDLRPEMSAFKLTEKVLQALKQKDFNFVLVNFANPDMVGHSGNIKAAVKAIQAVDKCLGKLVEKALQKNYSVVITADHGNAEQMLYDNGSKNTSHTTNKVPLIIVSKQKTKLKLKTPSPSLASIAPTVLHLMGLEKPRQMTSASLLL